MRRVARHVRTGGGLEPRHRDGVRPHAEPGLEVADVLLQRQQFESPVEEPNSTPIPTSSMPASMARSIAVMRQS